MSALKWRSPREFFSQKGLYNAAIGLSLFFSVGGIFYAAFISKCKEDAERCGAIGVAIAFAILFLRRNYGERLYRFILEAKPELETKIKAVVEDDTTAPLSNEELSWLLIAILGRFNVEADEQKHQNLALVIASVVGTIVWGFGHIFAGWLM